MERSERPSMIPLPVYFIRRKEGGGEANVDVESRREFPGIGGTINTRYGITSAFRKENTTTPKSGHRTFLRHLIAKKIEDFFIRTSDNYTFSHITRPLGSVSQISSCPCQASIYQWASGREGFPWEITGRDCEQEHIHLKEWNVFESKFMSAGIDMGKDVTDPNDGRISQNIIHEFPDDIDNNTMAPTWKRIDIGEISAKFDLEKLAGFIRDNRSGLISALKWSRYEMIRLAVQYLINSEMDRKDIGILETHIGNYRIDSLEHYLKGLVPANKKPFLDSGRQSLCDDCD